MPSSGDNLLQQLRQSLDGAKYSASSVLAGLAVSVGGSLIAFLIFLIIRTHLKRLYSPNVFRRVFEYPGNGLFAWVSPVFHTSEEEIIAKLGLDAAIYLRTLKMLRNVFLILALLGCGIGIPINVVFNFKSKWGDNLSKSDAFLLMTPTLISGKPMIAHIVSGWVFNGVIMFFLWRNFSTVLNLRRNEFLSTQHQSKLENRSILITDLKKSARSKHGLRALASTMSSEAPAAVSIGTSVKRLESLLEKHTHAVLEYEKATFARERALEKSKPVPLFKLADGGQIDASTHWRGQIDKFEKEIFLEREDARQEHHPLSYGFLSYDHQSTAHSVVKNRKGYKTDGAAVQLAPSPVDIIWPNLVIGKVGRANKQMWVNIIFTALMVLWIVPNAFIGCFLTNLSRIGALWPRFAYTMDQNKVGFAILQGVAAPLVTTLVFMILPWIMRKLSRWQGKITRNEREKEVTRKLYAFFFFNNFFVFTLMGVVWDAIAQTLQIVNSASPGHKPSFGEVWDELKVAQRISTAILNVSSFWVMYLLKSFFGVMLDQLQLLSLTQIGFQRAFSRATPRQLQQWKQPQSTPFAVQYIWPLFYTTICLGFTIIQPLVLAIGAIYFLLVYPVKKYQLMYMFLTKYESDGLFWPIVNNIILFAAGFGNLMLLCIVWVQSGWRYAMGVVPLPVIMVLFKIVLWANFDRHYYLFVDGYNRDVYFSSAQTELEDRYENPALWKALEVPLLSDLERAETVASFGSQEKNRPSPYSQTSTLVGPAELAKNELGDYSGHSNDTQYEYPPYEQQYDSYEPSGYYPYEHDSQSYQPSEMDYQEYEPPHPVYQNYSQTSLQMSTDGYHGAVRDDAGEYDDQKRLL